MRTIVAWVVGIIVAGLLIWAGTVMLGLLGVPTWIDLGETITVTRGGGRYSYEEEVDGFRTSPGYVLIIVAIMLAARVGMWITSGKPSGDLQRDGELQFRAWLFGLLAFGGATTILHVVLPHADGVRGAGELAAAVAAAWWFRRWYEDRCRVAGAEHA